MPVYVDPLFDWPGPHGLCRWCHMRADTLDELHAMADLLGMKREWFQDKPGAPHYDLIPSHRELAIELGAIQFTRRQWVTHFSAKPALTGQGVCDPSLSVPSPVPSASR